MTLVSIDNPKREMRLTGMLKNRYRWLVQQLGPDLSPIEARLNQMIDGERIHTAGWMPGSDWTGTPFQRIWEVCGRDQDEAAKCFGLIVWKVFEKHPGKWGSGHGMQHGQEIRSRTYFRLDSTEERRRTGVASQIGRRAG